MKRFVVAAVAAALGVGAVLAVLRLRALGTPPPSKVTRGGTGQALVTECAGPQDARINLVYLHGIDPPDASPQEQGNRQVIARLADQLRVRIALARSPDPCPRDAGKRCWPNDSVQAVKDALGRLQNDTAACFAGKPANGMIGFSNGGYFVSKLIQYCLLPHAAAVVAIGSGGGWHSTDPQDLSACARMIVLIGKDDVTHGPAVDYTRHLQSLKGHVSLREYPGGHVLPRSDLLPALTALFPLAPVADAQ